MPVVIPRRSWLEVLRLPREWILGACAVSDCRVIQHYGKHTIGPKTKVGLMIESENFGFSFSMNFQAAFSANALLAAGLLEFVHYDPDLSNNKKPARALAQKKNKA
jgi:hypothetical protein